MIDDLGVVGEHLGDLLLDSGDVLTVGDADVDRVVDALGAEHLGGGRRIPQGERGAAERVAVAESDRAGEGERVRTRGGDDVDRIADLEVVVVGRVLVDGDLVGSARRGALAELDRAAGVGAIPRGAEHRCPAGGDRLAVGVDDLGAALQLSGGPLHPGYGGDGVDELGRDGVACAGVAAPAERQLGADLEVGVLEGIGEQRVESGTHAVGEHERADDERHAEDDGDGDGDQPADPGAHAAARQQKGRVGAHVSPRSASPGRAPSPASGRAARRRCGRR